MDHRHLRNQDPLITSAAQHFSAVIVSVAGMALVHTALLARFQGVKSLGKLKLFHRASVVCFGIMATACLLALLDILGATSGAVADFFILAALIAGYTLLGGLVISLESMRRE